MRLHEFAPNQMIDRYVVVLKNLVGRASAKKSPAKMNWEGLNQILRSNDASLATDYETFKAMYDQSPALQTLVKNFNSDGVVLDVPGAPNEKPKQSDDKKDSQDAIDKKAASAAPKQLAQQ